MRHVRLRLTVLVAQSDLPLPTETAPFVCIVIHDNIAPISTGISWPIRTSSNLSN